MLIIFQKIYVYMLWKLTWQIWVYAMSKMNLFHQGIHLYFQIWSWFVQKNFNWNWKREVPPECPFFRIFGPGATLRELTWLPQFLLKLAEIFWALQSRSTCFKFKISLNSYKNWMSWINLKTELCFQIWITHVLKY